MKTKLTFKQAVKVYTDFCASLNNPISARYATQIVKFDLEEFPEAFESEIIYREYLQSLLGDV